MEDLTTGLWLTYLWRSLSRSKCARFVNLPTFLEASSCREEPRKFAMLDEVTFQKRETLSQRDSKWRRPLSRIFVHKSMLLSHRGLGNRRYFIKGKRRDQGTGRIGQSRSDQQCQRSIPSIIMAQPTSFQMLTCWFGCSKLHPSLSDLFGTQK